MSDCSEYTLKAPDGHTMGPLPVDIIEELVKQGEITADFLYLCPQSGEWLSIRELPLLKRASFLPSELQDMPHIKPSPHLGWGIVLTFIGILPLGIWAIFKSLKVAEHYGAGRYAQARRASDSVRNICLLNVLLTIVLWGVYVCVKHRLGT